VTRRAQRATSRDQAPSGFSTALERLCGSTNALSAALVDSIGETVDYAGVVDPFDTKVAAAEWALILESLKSTESLDWRWTTEFSFRGRKRTFVVTILGQGYALVIELRARRLNVSARALSEAVRIISEEAGLELPSNWASPRERWTRVQVRSDKHQRRPNAFMRAGQWCLVEVLGRLARNQLKQCEAGYRVRTEDGAELTLIREPLGYWYADDPSILLGQIGE
jgi:hypothetical protein